MNGALPRRHLEPSRCRSPHPPHRPETPRSQTARGRSLRLNSPNPLVQVFP